MLSALVGVALAPHLPFAYLGEAEPKVSALSAVVMDADTGRVLWQKDAHTPRFPASTTKIMTGLLLVENCRPDEMITAPADVESVKEASLHLRPTERLSAEHMLYGIMVRSANDASYAIACHISGTESEFVKRMNARAKELGCKNTNFRNPHGLNDPNHTTTAYDLALIARQAMTNEWFRQAAKAKTVTIGRSLNQQDTLLKTKNRFLDDAGAEGIKTGYTNPAGHCFVGAKSLNGWRLITVVLKSQDWLTDTRTLFSWAFAKFERKAIGSRGDPVAIVPVIGGELGAVPGRLGRGLSITTQRGGGVRSSQISALPVEAPVHEGQVIGEYIVTAEDGTEVRAPIVSSATIARIAPQRESGVLWWAAIGIAAACVLAYRRPWKKRQRQRPRHA